MVQDCPPRDTRHVHCSGQAGAVNGGALMRQLTALAGPAGGASGISWLVPPGYCSVRLGPVAVHCKVARGAGYPDLHAVQLLGRKDLAAQPGPAQPVGTLGCAQLSALDTLLGRERTSPSGRRPGPACRSHRPPALAACQRARGPAARSSVSLAATAKRQPHAVVAGTHDDDDVAGGAGQRALAGACISRTAQLVARQGARGGPKPCTDLPGRSRSRERPPAGTGPVAPAPPSRCRPSRRRK